MACCSLCSVCTRINSLGQAGSLGAGAAQAPCSWYLSPSPLEPPKKLPSHLPDPLRPPLLCSPHARLDKLTSCMISFFLLPPLPVLNSSKPRSEAKHKLDEQSLSQSYNPALCLTKQRREFCSL